jgi:hypothetical protein
MDSTSVIGTMSLLSYQSDIFDHFAKIKLSNNNSNNMVIGMLLLLFILALQPFVGPWPLLQFLFLYTVGRTRTGDQLVVWPLPTHRTTQAQNKRTQISMPGVGFEPTIPVFERAKRVHALVRASTEIGDWYVSLRLFYFEQNCSNKISGNWEGGDNSVLWNITSCRPWQVNRSFGGICCLHF